MSSLHEHPRIAVDVGGTFTDAALVEPDGTISVVKVPTTPDHPAEGFVGSLDAATAGSETEVGDTAFLAHGTTVATNALVQGRTARVGLVLTRGFRDVLAIGTQQRSEPYDPRVPNPAPMVPDELCFEVDERIAADGSVVTELDEADVSTVAADLKEAQVEAVAVCLLFSFANDQHERRVAALLSEALPDLPISLSSEICPEFREYPRASTTAINAALLPLMNSYLMDLQDRTARLGLTAPVNLMQSNGGLASAERGAHAPVNLIASGPAAGVMGAAQVGRAAGSPDLLSFDMGGTTADVGLVVGGEAQIRFTGEVSGNPVSLPQVDVLSVGAGAGSIARVDEFGSLRVGPESAGAVPGPAAYGRGGERATVADAHLVLGTLSPDNFVGGRMQVDVDAARAVVEKDVAEPLGMSVQEAAAAILRIADVVMAGALRVLSVARGLDPRELALVAFGGAGPLHACRLATELGIRQVLVPRYPGAGSAVGMLSTDVRYDFAETWVAETARVDIDELKTRFDGLQERGLQRLEEAGIGDSQRDVEFQVGMRYRGQAYELPVPVNGALTGGGVPSLERDFRVAHERAYGHGLDAPMEIVTLRAKAVAEVGSEAWRKPESDSAGDSRTRSIWTEGSDQDYAVHSRDQLRAGAELAGPAIVEQDDSTTVLPAGWCLQVTEGGTMRLNAP